MATHPERTAARALTTEVQLSTTTRALSSDARYTSRYKQKAVPVCFFLTFFFRYYFPLWLTPVLDLFFFFFCFFFLPQLHQTSTTISHAAFAQFSEKFLDTSHFDVLRQHCRSAGAQCNEVFFQSAHAYCAQRMAVAVRVHFGKHWRRMIIRACTHLLGASTRDTQKVSGPILKRKREREH